MGKEKALIYDLPTSVEVNGKTYQIESDYRAVLDILAALSDNSLTAIEHTVAVLVIFYPDFDAMPTQDYEEALRQCYRFIGHEREEKDQKKQPTTTLMSWGQDFDLIVAPINRIAGCEIRTLEYLHWYSFLSYYQEIGDCLFAHVVSIRDKKARGKTLDKQEREFYRRNRDIIDIKTDCTDEEKDVLAAWGVSK